MQREKEVACKMVIKIPFTYYHQHIRYATLLLLSYDISIEIQICLLKAYIAMMQNYRFQMANNKYSFVIVKQTFIKRICVN